MRRPPFSRDHGRLAWWLGPLAPKDRPPTGVTRTSVQLPKRDGRPPLEALLYAPATRAPHGALVVSHGLQYLGPADPRMDRFLRILAHSGLAVLAPFIPDYLRLTLAPGALADFQTAVHGMLARPEVPAGAKVGLFSISFGSLLVLRAAAEPALASRVGGVVCFGGYADWQETLRFALSGQGDGAHDPLNSPAVFLNLERWIDGAPADREVVCAAWRRFCYVTWGHPAMKQDGQHQAVARLIARDLPAPDRELFLLGCGIGGRTLEVAGDALRRAREPNAYLDPRPYLGRIEAPVHVVHGADDDVISVSEADALEAAFPPGARVSKHLTGLYGHTAAGGLSLLTGAASELRTLGAIVSAILDAGRFPVTRRKV